MNAVPQSPFGFAPQRTPANAQLNLNVRSLAPSATLAVNEHSARLQQAGKQVYRLGLGQSPFPVPDVVVQALRDNAHQKDYLPVKGLPALREAVAGYHQRVNAVAGGGEDVLIGPGSKELMFILQLVYYGDLLVPAPSWVSYTPQASIIGRQVHWITTQRDHGWRLQPAELDALCRGDPTRPRLLILNYPSNPLGVSYDDDQLAALAAVAQRYGVIVLSDEIYGELYHQGQHRSIARHYPEGTIISSGLSKWAGAGGWRLGTFLFPPALRWLQEAMAVVASETFTTTSAPIQYAVVRAYQGGPEIGAYLHHSRRILRALGGAVVEQLAAAGIQVAEPEGGFYLFPDFTAQKDSLAERGIHTSPQLCEGLLRERGVATLPGSDFGRPADELSFRLADVDFDGSEALKAAAHQGRIDRAFLNKYCGRVMAASAAIADWAT